MNARSPREGGSPKSAGRLDHHQHTPEARQAPASQLTLDDALVERDTGATAALLSAHTSWRLAAERAVAQLAAAGGPFTIDDVYERVGQPPGHLNAAGGLVLAAAKAGRVEPVGYRPSTRPEARGRPVRVWRGRAA